MSRCGEGAEMQQHVVSRVPNYGADPSIQDAIRVWNIQRRECTRSSCA